MKKKLYNKILSSQMLLIVFFALSLIFFITLFLNLYIKKDMEKQLTSTAELLTSNFNKDLSKSELIKGTEEEASKSLLKLNKLLRERASYLDINFFILNEDKTIAFPKNLKGNKGEAIKNILTEIEGKKSTKLNVKDINGEYAVLLYPVTFTRESESGYFVLFSDLDKRNNMVSTINFIIISIVIVVGFLTFIISKTLAKNISTPILALKSRAINIGNKNYIKTHTATDIEELQELENAMTSMASALESHDKAMNTFFQNASHDLRTPLMSIQGYAEGIKYKVLENSEDGIEVIISETKRLSTLVDELLLLSKIDTMDNFYLRETLDISQLMNEIIETSRGLALLDGKTILYNESKTKAEIKASEEMLSRAILNIISNCIRHCRGEVIIETNILDGNFIIQIMDDGLGFDENDIPRIFDRFYKGTGGGNGLGLTISKGVVEALGGSICCGNRVNEGAYFTISLPINTFSNSV